MILVDTNVWLRSVQPTHPLHRAAVETVAGLIGANESLAITPQIAAEFWNVATRPVTARGFGLSTAEARDQIGRLEEFVSLVAESAEVYAEWKRLVITHDVQGVQVHDARLVAAMRVYGIRRIATFNARDFRRYQDIEIVIPS